MNRGNFSILGTLAAVPLALIPTFADAICREPIFSESEPRPPGQYQRPEQPPCLGGGHSDACEAHELRQYENDLDGYLFRLERYVETSRRFSEAAAELAAEAEAYAECEAEEAEALSPG